eukprot:247511-Amphidinium_carterae.1
MGKLCKPPTVGTTAKSESHGVRRRSSSEPRLGSSAGLLSEGTLDTHTLSPRLRSSSALRYSSSLLMLLAELPRTNASLTLSLS